MYREPKAAKRLYFDIIPRNVDEYHQFLAGYERQDARQRLTNPVWHIHSGHPPKADMPISFQMLLTLVSSSNAENAETLVGLHRPLPAGRDGRDASQAQRAGRIRHPLFPRLRAAGKEIPRGERSGTRGADRPARRAVATGGGRQRRRYPERGLRGRPPRALPRPQEESQGRQAGRVARLVQHALPGAARPGERPALRLVRRGLRPAEHHRHDRRRAGAQA